MSKPMSKTDIVIHKSDEHDAKILKKTLANQICQYIKRILYNQVGFTLGM